MKPRPSKRLKPPPPPPPPEVGGAAPTGAAAVDAELVSRAYRKVMNKEKLSAQETSALKRHEAAKEERLRWQYYRSIPKKHWTQMARRQVKVLNEQAERYGLPCGGPTVSLPDFLLALHNFLADNALKLAKEEDELMTSGGNSPALERYREERAALARLDRLEREQQLLPRDKVREQLGQIASIIRGAGEALQRQFGPAALDILTESLDDAQRQIEQAFGASHECAADPAAAVE